MSTQTHSGGTAGDHQFVDTVGGFTGVHGPDGFALTLFDELNYTLNGTQNTGLIFFHESLASLTLEAGYILPKMFQFYKISKVEYWFLDIDYGTNWGGTTGETQSFHIYMAPWKVDPLTASGTSATINVKYLPGCVWKIFQAPGVGTKQQISSASSGTSQVLSIVIHEPAFAMNTYNPASSTSVAGRQYQNTPLPTYARTGIDETRWQTMVLGYKRASGTTAHPNPIYFIMQTKITYLFKGVRILSTPALCECHHEPESKPRERGISVPGFEHTRIKSAKRRLDYVGSNPPKRAPGVSFSEVLPRDEQCSEGFDRSGGDLSDWPTPLACSPAVSEQEKA